MPTTHVFDGLIIRGLPTGTQDGINGTQYQERAVTTDEQGKELFARLLDPVPISQAEPAKLEALFSRLGLGALAQVETLTAQLAASRTETKTAQDETKAAQSETKAAQSENAAKTARIADLEAQLAAATAPQTGSPDGFTIPETNIVLDDSEQAQSRFTSMVTLIQLAQAKGLLPDNAPQTVADRDGNPHELPTSAFLLAMLGYGQHCQALFAAALKK